jgi:hypothetical protein
LKGSSEGLSTGNKLVTSDLKEELNILMDDNMNETIVKAIVVYNHEVFSSNEIAFYNRVNVSSTDTDIDLVIKHGENSKDSYFYNQFGKLNNSSDALTSRILEIHHIQDDSVFDGATVYWYIPQNKELTMIEPVITGAYKKINKSNPNYKEGFNCYQVTQALVFVKDESA